MTNPIVHQLSNGFTLAIEPVDGVESISLNLHAAVGSRQETKQLNGLAHLFEHMVFKGAGGRNSVQLSEAVEDVGGSFNAYTTFDHTVFQTRLLADSLDLGINVLADMVRAPHFYAEDLEREKDVVLQELSDSKDDPSDVVETTMQELAYPDQSMGRHIIGSEQSVRSIQSQDLHDWANNHYTSGGLVLSVAGKVDPDAIIRLAEQRFGDMPIAPRASADPLTFHSGSKYDNRDIESAHLIVGFEGPGGLNADRHALQLFSHGLGEGFSSRLFQEIRGIHGLAYSISSLTQMWSDAGMFGAYLATDPAQAGKALKMTLDVMNQAADSYTEEEVKRAKIQIKSQTLMALESVKKRAMRNGNRLVIYGELVPLSDTLALLEAVDLTEVKRVASKILSGPQVFAAVGWDGN